MPTIDTSIAPQPENLLDGLLAAWKDEALEFKHAQNRWTRKFEANEKLHRQYRCRYIAAGQDD